MSFGGPPGEVITPSRGNLAWTIGMAIDHERHRLLVRQARRGLPGLVLAAAFLAVTVGRHQSNGRFMVWIVVMAFDVAAHVVAVVHDERRPDRQLSWSGVALSVVHGAAWSLGAVLLWPPDRAGQLLLLATLLALIAGVCVVTAPLPLAAALFVVPLAVVTAVLFLLDDNDDAVATGVGTLLFAAVMLTVQMESSRTITELVRLRVENEALTARLAHLAATDPLTGVANRRRFLETLRAELDEVRAHSRPSALALLDLDHFKRVNDVHGHPVGDAVLCEFSDLVGGELDPGEHLARVGGEEFAVLLPRATALAARPRLERVRARVAAEIRHGPGAITVSIGIVELGTQDDDVSAVQRADAALYLAKRDGRDRVVVLEGSPPPAVAG